MARHTNLVIGVFCLNLAGKFLGFLRVQQISVQLGVTYVADALFLALIVVALWEAVVMSGACIPSLTAAFVRWTNARNTDHAIRKTVRLCSAFVLLATLITVLVFIFAETIAHVIGPGLSDEGTASFVRIVRALSLTPIFASVTLFLAAINRLHHGEMHFAAVAIIVNMLSLPVLILGPHWFDDATSVAVAYCASITIASAIATIYQLAFMNREIRVSVVSALTTELGVTGPRLQKILADCREFFPLWLPLLGAVGALEINSIIDMAFASTVQEGGAAGLSYADRLTKIVLAVLGGAIFVVADPRWSKLLSKHDGEHIKAEITQDVQAIVVVIAPLYLALFMLPVEIANFAFGYGRMDESAISLVAQLIPWLALAGFMSFLSLAMSRALTFEQLPGLILRVNLVAIVLNVILNYLLIPILGIVGIAVATFIMALVQLFFLSVGGRKVRAARSVIRGIIGAPALFCGLAAGLTMWACQTMIAELWPVFRILLSLAAGYTASAAVYFLLRKRLTV